MLKRITGTALAGAMAITSLGATPAQARDKDEELLRLFAGIAALTIIAKAAEENNRRDRHTYTPRYSPQPQYTPERTPRIQAITPRKAEPRRKALPGRCERDIRTRDGRRTIFGKPCLERAGFRHKLPKSCRVIVDLPNRSIKAWRKRCLLNAGYRIR